MLPLSLWAQNDEELFSQVFGTEVESSYLRVPVLLDGEVIGDVPLEIRPGFERVLLQADSMGRLLSSYLSEEAMRGYEERVLFAASDDGYIPLDDLSDLDLNIRFNRNLVQLELSPAGEVRRLVSLSRSQGRPFGTLLQPEPVSGYLNVWGSSAIRYSAVGDEEETETPLALRAQPLLNIRSFVIEGEGTLSSENDPRVGYARAIYDVVSWDTRFTGGTLNYPLVGYQEYEERFGVMATNYRSLFPRLRRQPYQESSFYLDRPERVRVYVNDRVFDSYDLGPGPYRVRDFPLARGVNTVRVVIAPGTSREREVVLKVPYANDLLPPGVDEFSLAYGAADREGFAPLGSGYYRIGILPQLTTTAYGQGSEESAGGGAIVTWASRAGIFTLDGAGSAYQYGELSLAGTFDYFYTSNQLGGAPGYGVRARYLGEAFTMLGTEVPENKVASDYEAYTTGDLGEGGSYSFSVTMADLRIGPDPYQVALDSSVGVSLSGSASLRLQFGVAIGPETANVEGAISLRLTPGGQGSLFSRYDIGTGLGSATYTHQPEEYLREPRYSVGYSGYGYRQDGRVPADITANGSYIHQRFSTDLSGQLGFPLVSNNFRDNYVFGLAQVGSAIAFAGSSVTISRPIDNGFAILLPDDNLDPYTIGVNGTDKHAEALMTGSSAAYPVLQEYLPATISLLSPDLPRGVSLGETTYRFMPQYASGYRIRVGTGATVYVTGTLVTADGEPLSLQAGELVRLNAEAEAPQLFFTNRQGYFEAHELRPGAYDLRLFGPVTRNVPVTIPEESEGEYSLGRLEVTR